MVTRPAQRNLNGFEYDLPTGVAEGNVEMFEDVFAAHKTEADPQARGKADDAFEFNGADFDKQTVNVNRYLTSVANSYQRLNSPSQLDAEAVRVFFAKNRETCPGIDESPYLTPSVFSFDRECDDGRWIFSVQKAVLKNYSAQTKSSGLGTRRPLGMTPGCLRRASISRAAGSKPTKSSPPATMAYFPAYLSTSILKWRRIHSSSFIFFAFFRPFFFIGSSLLLKDTPFIAIRRADFTTAVNRLST
jgi:hypothetical protein